ncbi:MAG TPA: RluA family pseudouridine synthase [Myxococcaceae bacterium]|nr:RluA family pseudouridine synthase [Myxococcaceae bacterium]
MSGEAEPLFQVGPEAEGSRLDLFVGERLGLSRAKVKALIEAGAVSVDGRRAAKGVRVSPGQTVRVRTDAAPEEEPALIPDPGAPLTVLSVDDALVFMDKPAGRASHPLKPGERGTLANALAARYPECALASEEPREGGLCHRLDVETSGVIVAARTREAWTAVRAHFSARAVEKQYWALVTGPLADEGEIELPLRHHPRHADRVEPALNPALGGREALSHFRVIGRSGDYSLVEVQISTGVLHQVRAHLAAIGAPVVGDTLYGGRPQELLSRFFLHARTLGVPHPLHSGRVRVHSPLPPELEDVLRVRGISAPPGPVAGKVGA